MTDYCEKQKDYETTMKKYLVEKTTIQVLENARLKFTQTPKLRSHPHHGLNEKCLVTLGITSCIKHKVTESS